MSYLFVAIGVSWLCTYLLRVTPLVVFRGRITNQWVLRFLHYVPYAVLTDMTIPAIVLATSSWISGAVALVLALVAAWRGQQMMVVCVIAAGAVWVTEFLLRMVGAA